MAYFKNIDRFGNELTAYYPPQCVQAFMATAQTVPHAADTTLVNWTTQLDTSAGAWNNVSGVFTANRAGYFRITGSVVYSQGQSWPASVVISTHVVKNGVRYATSFFSEKVAHTQFLCVPAVTAVVQLAAGDTLRLVTYQNSGGARNTLGQPITQWPFFISINEIV
jgi:hypothetical protein